MTKNVALRAAPGLSNAHVKRSNPYCRNPWIADQQCMSVVSSSASSYGMPTYYTIDGPGPGPPSVPLRPVGGSAGPNHDERFSSFPRTHTSVTRKNIVKYSGRGSYHACSSNPDTALTYQETGTGNTLMHGRALSSRGMSHSSSERPVTPVSISTIDGVVDPCGGHCRPLERFCHYFLQVLFIACILGGVSLVLAGYILHGQKRGGDLRVLVYIGVLMAVVCTVLLSIQCSAEHEAKRKKRRRAAALVMRNRIPSEVPLRDLGKSTYVAGQSHTIEQTMQLPSYCRDANSGTRSPLIFSSNTSEYNFRSYDEIGENQNGIPWWRREANQYKTAIV